VLSPFALHGLTVGGAGGLSQSASFACAPHAVNDDFVPVGTRYPFFPSCFLPFVLHGLTVGSAGGLSQSASFACAPHKVNDDFVPVGTRYPFSPSRFLPFALLKEFNPLRGSFSRGVFMVPSFTRGYAHVAPSGQLHPVRNLFEKYSDF